MAQPSLLQENTFDTIIAELSNKLRPLAWRYSQAFIDLDLDDFLAIGLEGVAQAYRTTGRTDPAYLYGAARNQMREAFWRRTQKSVPTFSLDNYLYDKDADRERYIAEDITSVTCEASVTIKAKVAKLLATLPEKHQQILRARYQLDGADTVEEVCERYHLTATNTFHDTTRRAIVMIQRNIQRQPALGL